MIAKCNYFNDSQNSRSNICNGSIEFIDDQFSLHNSSSCSSSNTEDSLNCTVKNERNLNVLSLNCCGVKLRLQYPEFCELIKKNNIVCLQETKTDDIDKIDLEGYTFKMKNRKKNW